MIKLTRPDGSPVWVAAAAIVQIIRRGQGSRLFLAGLSEDLCDEDVHETAEYVLALMEEARGADKTL